MTQSWLSQHIARPLGLPPLAHEVGVKGRGKVGMDAVNAEVSKHGEWEVMLPGGDFWVSLLGRCFWAVVAVDKDGNMGSYSTAGAWPLGVDAKRRSRLAFRFLSRAMGACAW